MFNVTEINPRMFLDCQLFKQLTEMEIEQLLGLCDFHQFPTGRTIWREGLLEQSLWCVVSGRCTVVRTVSGGMEHQLATLGPSDLFGEVSFFSRSGHSATIRTLEDAILIRLSKDRFDELPNYGSLAQKIACNVSSAMATKFRRLENYTLRMLDVPSAQDEESTAEPQNLVPLDLYRPPELRLASESALPEQRSPRASYWPLVSWVALIIAVACGLVFASNPEADLSFLQR